MKIYEKEIRKHENEENSSKCACACTAFLRLQHEAGTGRAKELDHLCDK